jgi:hypothetical protein
MKAGGKQHSAFTLVSCLAYSSTLKMEVTCPTETLVDFQRTARSYIPEDITHHNHLCENLKSYNQLELPYTTNGNRTSFSGIEIYQYSSCFTKHVCQHCFRIYWFWVNYCMLFTVVWAIIFRGITGCLSSAFRNDTLLLNENKTVKTTVVSQFLKSKPHIVTPLSVLNNQKIIYR